MKTIIEIHAGEGKVLHRKMNKRQARKLIEQARKDYYIHKAEEMYAEFKRNTP